MEEENVGAQFIAPVLTVDEAKRLRPAEITKGLRVKGLSRQEDGTVVQWGRDDETGLGKYVLPFGGGWRYDPATDELTLEQVPAFPDEEKAQPKERE